MSAGSDAGQPRPRVDIVGGGLAGLTVALRLAQQRIPVRLYERHGRLGGLAGSTLIEGKYEDHGLHIFPPWYAATWQLLDELNLATHFAPVDTYHQAMPGPRWSSGRMVGSRSPRGIGTNLLRSASTRSHSILFFYSVLELLSYAPDGSGGPWNIDTRTFIESRFCGRGTGVADTLSGFIRTGTGLENLDASIGAGVMSGQAARGYPMVYAATESVEEAFIAPLRSAVLDAGAEIVVNAKVTRLLSDGQKIVALEVNRDGKTESEKVDALVLTIGPEHLRALLENSPSVTSKTLTDASGLPTRQWGAVHLTAKRSIEVPVWVRFAESELGLSTLDVGRIYASERKNQRSVLQCAITNMESYNHLTDDAIVTLVVEELNRYGVALSSLDLESAIVQKHEDERLFVPAVGTWDARPGAISDITNVYLAGDYTRTTISIPSMEGAIQSGARAADAIRAELRPDSSPITVPDIPRLPPVVARIGKSLAAPAALWAARIERVRRSKASAGT